MLRDELRVAINKLSDGGSLSDRELAILESYYTNIYNAMTVCYVEQYVLVINDVANNLRRVQGYIRARKEDSRRGFPTNCT
jgi:hypothetical protein